jgi:AcrR family transcriptional regulator
MSVAVIIYDRGMGRWEPDARGRLEQAALALYGERGFEQTTVAEIAKRAGLTERTFFRYFADKREVLFWGAGTLQDFLVSTVASVPDSAAPIAAIAAALEAAGALRQRGVAEPAASLAAEAGIAVFRIAFERWIDETSQADLPQLIRDSLDDLKAVTAGM